MPTRCHRNVKAMDLRPASNSPGPGEGGLWGGRDSARAGMLRTVGSLKTTEAHTVDPYGFPHRVDHFTPAEILTSNLKRNQMLQKT